jgi:hypothetical protein
MALQKNAAGLPAVGLKLKSMKLLFLWEQSNYELFVFSQGARLVAELSAQEITKAASNFGTERALDTGTAAFGLGGLVATGVQAMFMKPKNKRAIAVLYRNNKGKPGVFTVFGTDPIISEILASMPAASVVPTEHLLAEYRSLRVLPSLMKRFLWVLLLCAFLAASIAGFAFALSFLRSL